MLLFFIKFIYQTFFMPPGIFIILLLIISFLAYRKKSQIWKITFGVTVFIYILSVPLIGDDLIHSLENNYTPSPEAKGDVIVMLGGGATLDTPNINGYGHLSGYAANRLLTCAQLYHKLNVPVIISGGQLQGVTGSDAIVGKNILIGLGVPESMILVESKSLNTTQNARFTKELIERNGFKDIILVTSAFHMSRSVRQFEKVDLNVTPYPADYQTNIKKRFILNDLIPSADAMSKTSLSIKEYIGLMASGWY